MCAKWKKQQIRSTFITRVFYVHLIFPVFLLLTLRSILELSKTKREKKTIIEDFSEAEAEARFMIAFDCFSFVHLNVFWLAFFFLSHFFLFSVWIAIRLAFKRESVAFGQRCRLPLQQRFSLLMRSNGNNFGMHVKEVVNANITIEQFTTAESR